MAVRVSAVVAARVVISNGAMMTERRTSIILTIYVDQEDDECNK